MIFNRNILGWDYIALVGFLWIMAGWDYQSRIHRNPVHRCEVSIGTMILRVTFFVLWFMSAFRGLDVANDTYAYYRSYLSIGSLGFAGNWRMEKGYIALNVLLSSLFPNHEVGFRMLLFLTSTLSYYALERWIEKHANTYGVCILAFYFLMNGNYISAIRQSVATAIMLLALNKLEQRKYVLFIVAVSIATLFHSTIIISLAFLFFLNRKYSWRNALVIVGIAMVATATNLVSRIIYLFQAETSYVTGEIGNLASVIVMSVLYIALLLLRNFASEEFLVKGDDDEKTISDDFYNYCIIMSLSLTIMSLRAPVLSRTCSYFTVAGLPYISNVLSSIKNHKLAFLIKVVFCIAIWAYSVAVLLLRPEWQHLWPYHFWWST